MSIVVDASVAVKWVLDEPRSEAAAALRSEELIAPSFWFIEAANALWRRRKIGDISTEEAMSLIAELLKAPVAAIAMEAYVESAVKLAAEIEHPVYDCAYLALALHRDTHVVTDDRRFAAAADRPELAGRVRLLGS